LQFIARTKTSGANGGLPDCICCCEYHVQARHK